MVRGLIDSGVFMVESPNDLKARKRSSLVRSQTPDPSAEMGPGVVHF